MKGVFITFEGGDGSGKSTHARLVAERLEKEGRDVLLTREPGDTVAGKDIREVIVQYELNPRAEVFLFLADRAQHIEEVVRPALEQGKIVICDRFSASTFAYQLAGRQLGDDALVKQMDAFARAGIVPDHTIYLDIAPEEAMKRRQEDTTQDSDRFDDEELAFHTRVRESFVEQATEEKWITLSTMGSQEENREEVYSVVIAILGES